MLLILLLLQVLPFLVLLGGKLVLLLLILLVQLCVAGVRRCGPLGRRKLFRVYSGIAATTGVFRATIVEFSRSGGSSDRRPAVVGGIPQRRILARCVQMLRLCSDRADVPLVRGSFFLGRGTIVDPAMAVVADAHIVSHVHFCFVHVVNDVDIYVRHRAIVEKVTAAPAPAFKTVAEVAEAVIAPAVETYGRAPVAVIPNKTAPAP